MNIRGILKFRIFQISKFSSNTPPKVCKCVLSCKNNFKIQEPPFEIKKGNRKIAIFHEPDLIEDYLIQNHDIDIILHGHTHRYRNEVINETLFFNPGESAGFQKGSNAIGLINLENLFAERIFF